MSVPVFFQRYQNRDQIAFERAEIVRILGPAAVMDGADLVGIAFSDSDGGEIYGANAETFDELSFGEGAGDRFFDALWRIADATGAFIYWLGDEGCSAVTKSSVLPHLPPDIVADTGPVRIVADGDALEEAIFAGDLFE
jgi:hypothetical protein